MHNHNVFSELCRIGQSIVDYCSLNDIHANVHINAPGALWVFVTDGGADIQNGFITTMRKLASAGEMGKEYAAPDVRWSGVIDLDEESQVGFYVHIWGVCKLSGYREEVVPAQPEILIPAKPAGVKTVPVYDCGMEVVNGN